MREGVPQVAFGRTSLLLRVVLLLLLLPCGQARADDWRIQVACDAANGSLRIGDEDMPGWPGPESGSRASALAEPGFGKSSHKNRFGDALRVQRKPLTTRCGKLTMRVQSEYLDADPDGHLGIITFASVEVFAGKTVVVPKVGFYRCEMSRDRFGFFGPCPQAYARLVEVSQPAGTRALTVVIHHSHEDASFEARETIEARHVKLAP